MFNRNKIEHTEAKLTDLLAEHGEAMIISQAETDPSYAQWLYETYGLVVTPVGTLSYVETIEMDEEGHPEPILHHSDNPVVTGLDATTHVILDVVPGKITSSIKSWKHHRAEAREERIARANLRVAERAAKKAEREQEEAIEAAKRAEQEKAEALKAALKAAGPNADPAKVAAAIQAALAVETETVEA